MYIPTIIWILSRHLLLHRKKEKYKTNSNMEFNFCFFRANRCTYNIIRVC